VYVSFPTCWFPVWSKNKVHGCSTVTGDPRCQIPDSSDQLINNCKGGVLSKFDPRTTPSEPQGTTPLPPFPRKPPAQFYLRDVMLVSELAPPPLLCHCLLFITDVLMEINTTQCVFSAVEPSRTQSVLVSFGEDERSASQEVRRRKRSTGHTGHRSHRSHRSRQWRAVRAFSEGLNIITKLKLFYSLKHVFSFLNFVFSYCTVVFFCCCASIRQRCLV